MKIVSTDPGGIGSVNLILIKELTNTAITHTNPASQNQTFTLPDATGTVLTTGNSDTPTTTTSSVVRKDFVLIDDGGTMKRLPTSNLGIGSGGGGGGGNVDTLDNLDSTAFLRSNFGSIVLVEH